MMSIAGLLTDYPSLGQIIQIKFPCTSEYWETLYPLGNNAA